jgi:hypothetical protein
MTARRINALLYGAAAVVSLAALAALAAGVAPLEEIPPRRILIASASTAPSPAVDEAQRAMLAPLEGTFSRPLRGKPAPAVRPLVTPAPAPSPSATITLVGTIGDSTALLRTPDGNVAARSVGHKLGDAEVVSVRRNEAELRIAGKIVTLRKTTEPVTP